MVNSKRDGEMEVRVIIFKSYYTLILKRKFGLQLLSVLIHFEHNKTVYYNNHA